MEYSDLGKIMEDFVSSMESNNVEKAKSAVFLIKESQATPHHLVRVFRVISNEGRGMAVREVDILHLKDFVANNWSPHAPGERSNISDADKKLIREKILEKIVTLPPLLRVRLGECVKTILNLDYPKPWPGLFRFISDKLKQGQQLGVLHVVSILANKYKNLGYVQQRQVSAELNKIFPYLLNIFMEIVQIENPAMEIAESIKLICKILLSSKLEDTIMSNENLLAWMPLFLNILERPVPIEGQPADPDQRANWGWWKVKKWVLKILVLLSRSFVLDNEAAEIFSNAYGGAFMEWHVNMLNVIRKNGYLPDKISELILQVLSHSTWSRPIYNLLQPNLETVLAETIFPLICYNDDDERVWEEDQLEYAMRYYEGEGQYLSVVCSSPRSAAMEFLRMLVESPFEDNLSKIMSFILEVFEGYGQKSPRQKHGAMIALGALHNKLETTNPFKNELEHLLILHIFPEVTSLTGHLRAQAAWVVGIYADNFSSQDNIERALDMLVEGLKDAELPVKVECYIALQSFVSDDKKLEIIDSLYVLKDVLKEVKNIESCIL